MQFQHITEDNGSIHKSTRERLDSKLMEIEAPSDGLLTTLDWHFQQKGIIEFKIFLRAFS